MAAIELLRLAGATILIYIALLAAAYERVPRGPYKDWRGH